MKSCRVQTSKVIKFCLQIKKTDTWENTFWHERVEIRLKKNNNENLRSNAKISFDTQFKHKHTLFTKLLTASLKGYYNNNKCSNMSHMQSCQVYRFTRNISIFRNSQVCLAKPHCEKSQMTCSDFISLDLYKAN